MALTNYSKPVYVPHNRKNNKVFGFIRPRNLLEAIIFLSIMSVLVILIIPFTKIATLVVMGIVVFLAFIILVGFRGFSYTELLVNKFKSKTLYKELHFKRIGYEGYRIREASSPSGDAKEAGKKRRKEKKERG